MAPAFELMDVVSGKAVGRDDVFAGVSDDARADGANCAATGCHGLLVMFICVHCPYVKYVEEELARIGRDYEGRIGIVAISSNDVEAFPQDAPGEMGSYRRILVSLPLPVRRDAGDSAGYDAACTPIFFCSMGRWRWYIAG
jgi:hypothetical protein